MLVFKTRLSLLSVALCGLVLGALAFLGVSADHYQTLGVSRSASKEDIKRAFRRLAKEHHPDKSTATKEQAEKDFIRVSEAYDVLSDDSKRREYDYGGSQQFNYYRQYQGGRQYRGHTELAFASTELHSGNFDVHIKRPVSPFWVILLYVDWNAQVQWFAPLWNEIVGELDGLVSMGHMDLMVEQRLIAQKLGLRFTRAPVILTVAPDGDYKLYSGHYNKELVTSWISKRYPDRIGRVRTAADVARVHREAWWKTRVFIETSRNKPSLLLRHLAHRYGSELSFSFTHTGSGAARALRGDRGNPTSPVMYVFNNGTDVATELEGKNGRVQLESVLDQWKHAALPEIIGSNFHELCRPSRQSGLPTTCIIISVKRPTMHEYWLRVMASKSAPEQQEHRDIHRAVQASGELKRASSSARVACGWMDADLQSQYFVDAFPSQYNASLPVQVLILGVEQQRYKWVGVQGIRDMQSLADAINSQDWVSSNGAIGTPESEAIAPPGLGARFMGYINSFPLLSWITWLLEKLIEAPLMSIFFLWFIASKLA